MPGRAASWAMQSHVRSLPNLRWRRFGQRLPHAGQQQVVSTIRIAVGRVDSNGRRNTSTGGIGMTIKKRSSDRSGRAALRSPGRPPLARRENYQQFWAAVAAGRSSEEAAIDAGVSPAVGGRWFRRAGGMPPSHFLRSSKPLSGRYLSFVEREEIAILRVQEHGVCAIARKLGRAPSTISRELRRNAATRCGGLEYRAT